jgi:hypothetical protein
VRPALDDGPAFDEGLVSRRIDPWCLCWFVALAFGAGFSCAKTSAADLLVQKYIEKREEVDWKRNSAFAAFGLLYLGGVQYAIYVPLFSRLFPSAATFTAKTFRQKLADVPGMINVAKQTALDQLVHHPFLYFPVFYTTKIMVTEGVGPLEGCAKGLAVYVENYKEDLPALWKIWVPATLVNFAFSPMWFRIPFVACTSMVWTCILSAMRGSAEVELGRPSRVTPRPLSQHSLIVYRKTN